MEESNPELELFRQEWRAEVSQRSRAEGKKASDVQTSKASSHRPQADPRLATDRLLKPSEEDEDNQLESQVSHGFHEPSAAPSDEYAERSGSKSGSREPRSALEHYEKAVEREAQGSLGDSLDLYRKAFKVDFHVLDVESLS